MRAGLAFREHRGGGGLDGDDLNLGVLLLEELAHAGHGAAGADAGDEDVDLAVGVVPDLGAGRGLVNGRVRGVHKLAGDDAVGVSFCNSSALAIAPFMPLEPSVSTSCAPYACISLRRSTDMVSGMVMITL